MRLTRAIDRYLDAQQLERDFTPRSLHSYAWTLGKLDDAYPDAMVHDFEGREGTDRLRRFLAQWSHLKASTRATRISHVKSFFDWLEQQDLIEANPGRKIQRPTKKKPHIDRPTEAELLLVRNAARCTLDEPEKPAILAMLGCGFRRQAVLESVWADWNLTDGDVRLRLKGGNYAVLGIDPDVLDEMRDCYRILEPEPDDHIWPSQKVALIGPSRNVRTVRDWKQPSSPQALWNMLHRVCKRAGVRPLHPHLLRHGFATKLDREDIDLRTIQFLMGHKDVKSTEAYLDERRLREAKAKLRDAAHKRRQPGEREAAHHDQWPEPLESGWRESNPRSLPAEDPAQQEPHSAASRGVLNDPEGGSQSG